MTVFSGTIRILRFNWPWYASGVLLTVVGIIVLGRWPAQEPWWMPVAAILGAANAWLLLSLVVSHHIYDRSPIAAGGWLRDAHATDVVILHAGHDEASPHVARLLPTARRWVFDVIDPAGRISPSLRRARAAATAAATAVPLERLPLPDASAELVLIIFAAHEIRADAPRVACFREVARIIGAHGRAVVVEHQRDAWNFLAYGPGCLHFLSRRTWMRTFSQAGLELERADTLTPWVHRFELKAMA